MRNRLSPFPGPFGLFTLARHAPGFLRVFGRLFADARVSVWAKLIPVAMVFWFLSPADLDWIPFAGWVDDVVILIFGGRLFVRCCPAEVVAEHVAAVGGRPASQGGQTQGQEES